MAKHLQREIESVKKHLLRVCALVEKKVGLATKSIEDKDSALAEQVIETDYEVDNAEVGLEEECLKVLALHQPVAIDLRVVVAVLKINNDLERIGDLAVNIAERGVYLATHTAVPDKFDFSVMADKVINMLKQAVDSFVKMDCDLARAVCGRDDEVDRINSDVYKLVKSSINDNPEHVNSLIHLLSVSRHLERIADLATNIAEDVVYMITGEIVRHGAEDYTEDRVGKSGKPDRKSVV